MRSVLLAQEFLRSLVRLVVRAPIEVVRQCPARPRLGEHAPVAPTRDFHKRHLEIRKRIPQHRRFLVRQVAARLLLNHRELIDKHLRQLQIDFALAGLWVRDLPEKKRGVLRLHHDKFNEALGKLPGLRVVWTSAITKLIDHEMIETIATTSSTFFQLVLVLNWHVFLWRPHDREDVRLFLKIFCGGAFFTSSSVTASTSRSSVCGKRSRARRAHRAPPCIQKNRCFDWRSACCPSNFFFARASSSAVRPFRGELVDLVEQRCFHRSRFFADPSRDKTGKAPERVPAFGWRRHNRPGPFARGCEQRNANPNRCWLRRSIPARIDPG